MLCNNHRRLLAVFMLLSCAALTGSTRGDDPTSTEHPRVDLNAIIERLGHEQYTEREKAHQELEKMGLEAFDALHAAQHHRDVEIAYRAHYLLRSLKVEWSRDTDSEDVKRILTAYGAQNLAERRNRMERLAGLPAAQGVSALCRLVRFESNELLSKQSALLVLNREPPQDKVEAAKLGDEIQDLIGNSTRTGAKWLGAYASTLKDPASALESWNTITQDEHRLFINQPELSDAKLVRDLLRWHAQLLDSLDQDEQAVAVMRRSMDLLEGNREQLLETVDWLMERQAWKVVDEVADRFSNQFQEDALLMYRLAEAQSQQGHREEAETTADKALTLTAENGESHIVIAFNLQDRGLFEWAEREYRHVMKIDNIATLNNLRSRFLLAEMLHDNLKENDAAEVLKGAVDAMEKEPAVMQIVQQRLGREPGGVKSRMHFFFANHFAAQGETKKAQEHLSQGVKDDPTDADLLIGMYRLQTDDEEFVELTKKQIEKATGHFRTQIAEYTKQASESPTEPIREGANRQLASANNQLAWLVSNTEGDFDEAVRCSHRSLELRPNSSGYYDTLGRCYFAKGDLENAVKYQAMAVELDPNSGQIVRQLELFQKALEDSKRQND